MTPAERRTGSKRTEGEDAGVQIIEQIGPYVLAREEGRWLVVDVRRYAGGWLRRLFPSQAMAYEWIYAQPESGS